MTNISKKGRQGTCFLFRNRIKRQKPQTCWITKGKEIIVFFYPKASNLANGRSPMILDNFERLKPITMPLLGVSADAATNKLNLRKNITFNLCY
jgi:peroxiredoxin